MALLKTAQVAAILRVSEATVRKYAHDGRLRYIEIGGREWRYTEEDVQKFINENRKEL